MRFVRFKNILRPRTFLNLALLSVFLVGVNSPRGHASNDDEPGAVRRYGAVCDGRADDTAALIRAGNFNQAVYISPSLVCRVTGPLTDGIRSGQRWYGGGKITTADGFNFTVFSVASKTDVTFDGLVGESGALDVPYNKAHARFIEFVSGSHRGRVINSRITGFQQAVRVHGSTDITIENNDVINADGWGISIQTDSDDAKITNNRISGTIHEHGVYVSGSRGNRIRAPIVQGNTVSESTYDGIKLSYTDDAVVANNVTFSNGGQGIYATVGTNRADVHDNVAHSNGKAGILVFDGSSSSDDNLIHSNTVRANRGPGIAVSSSRSGTVSRTSVENNIVEDNGQEDDGSGRYGIVVSGGITTSRTVIEGNWIRRQSIGVYVRDGTKAVIGVNEFENCGVQISETRVNAGN
jgi:parallel beta-helix repeat protein